jgi:phage terminase small subunit
VNSSIDQPNEAITPSRKLAAKERKIFDRVVSEFIHLQTSDAEQLTQYAEAVVRYEAAAKDVKKSPTIAVPVVNRSTGNIVGEKLVRNPAFATIKEAQAQVNALARRLLIDAHSTEKRQRLLTKKSRALAASETQSAEDAAKLSGVSEAEIQGEIDRLAKIYIHATPETLRNQAIWYFTHYLPLMNDGDDDYLNVPIQ